MLQSGFNILPRSVFWSAYLNGRSDNLDVMSLGTAAMTNSKRKIRLRLSLRAALTGLFLASLVLGIWTSRSLNQKRAIIALKKLGGDVMYDDYESRRLDSAIARWLGPDFAYGPYSIDLGETDISDADLQHVAQLPSIVDLQLHETNVTGTGFDNLLPLKKLESLTLGGTKITNESLRHVGQMTSLTYLGVGHNTNIGDDGIRYLSALKNLNGINLWYTRTGDEGLKTLSALPKLRRIFAGGTNISDAGTSLLRGNEILEELILQKTKIGDETLKYLSEIKSLKELHVSETGITDAGLDFLKNCNSLTKLSISANENISPAGRAKLQLRLPTTAIR